MANLLQQRVVNDAVIAGVSSSSSLPSFQRNKRAAFVSKKLMQKTSNSPMSSNRGAQSAKKVSKWSLVKLVFLGTCLWILFFVFMIVHHHSWITTTTQETSFVRSVRNRSNLVTEEGQIPLSNKQPRSKKKKKILPRHMPPNTPQDDERLRQAKQTVLAPLTSPMDREKYTIRMNTWRRNEQLLTSINHHSSCEGVAQIQVIWSDTTEEPPQEILHHKSGKVIVERHEVNSLNERYHILSPITTLGILSLDDDVLRPCEAWDSGFFRWTKSPDSIVAYDYRSHEKTSSGEWKYLGLNATRYSNQYSVILLRAAFIHRDYMNLYMSHLPRNIFDVVATNFNCEDLAMSLFVTYLTDGMPHLLADLWATDSLVKIYSHSGGISGKTGHKLIRHECITDFSKALGLFEGDEHELPMFQLVHDSHSVLELGAPLQHRMTNSTAMIVSREDKLMASVQDFTWRNINDKIWKWQIPSIWEAMKSGLIQNTVPWEKRWGKHSSKSLRLTKEEYWMALALLHGALDQEQIQWMDQILKKIKETDTTMHKDVIAALRSQQKTSLGTV